MIPQTKKITEKSITHRLEICSVFLFTFVLVPCYNLCSFILYSFFFRFPGFFLIVFFSFPGFFSLYFFKLFPVSFHQIIHHVFNGFLSNHFSFFRIFCSFYDCSNTKKITEVSFVCFELNSKQ